MEEPKRRSRGFEERITQLEQDAKVRDTNFVRLVTQVEKLIRIVEVITEHVTGGRVRR
jgi:hypothetical protein